MVTEQSHERKKYSKTQRPAKGSLPQLKLQERDEDVLKFLEWLGVADATQLAVLLRDFSEGPTFGARDLRSYGPSELRALRKPERTIPLFSDPTPQKSFQI
jgi:hypothetical protein